MDGLREAFGDVVHVAMMGSGRALLCFAQELTEATGGYATGRSRIKILTSSRE